MASASQPAVSMRLDFSNLPLVEAAVRASFRTPTTLTFPKINALANRLKPDFPVLTEPNRMEVPPGISGTMQFDVAQIMGAVYTGNPRGLSIAVYPQLVVARWARKVGSESPDYPRFEVLEGALWNAVEGFLESTADDGLSRIGVVNMSYVNFLKGIPSTDLLRSYCTENAHVRATLNAGAIHKVEVSWREEQSLDLRFVVEAATAHEGDETTEGSSLTTVAGVKLDEGADPKKGLKSVHGRLQTFFQALISKQAQSEWGLKVRTDG